MFIRIRRILTNPLHYMKKKLEKVTKTFMICLFLKLFYPLSVVENWEFQFVSILGIEMIYIEIQYLAMEIR